MNAKKQTEIEKSDSYPAPDQSHTRQQNFKKILIVKEIRNVKKDKSEVVKSMPLSAPQQTDKTTASNKMYKSAPEQTDETTAINEMSKSTQQQADDTTPSNKISKSTQQKTDETTALNKMSKSTEQQTDDSTALKTVSQSTQKQTDERMDSNKMPKSAQQQLFETTDSIKILDSTRKPNRNLLRTRPNSLYADIAVDDKYPTDDIFLKLDDNELIGFYQVQEQNLFPVIENVSDIKRIELFKKLHDQHIAVIQSNTVDNNQSSSSGSTLADCQDAGQNGGTLKATMKSFVKKLIPDCITNGNQCHPTENLSSNWQIIKIRSGTNIKTRFIPIPPNSPKPKTPNARRKRYGRKMDEHNNPPESLKTIRF
ncbi:Hypothetical predicted protein [Mytilus galloprovincialis]|uniref:Uncharacterized protein n=1 Tax=Mytilus galloprovincialis TaxID=29158 RepID=A0A8B6GKF4_MYTGA|nr:Hypothetical predicted protein [Mytilus galloprovincialis]